MDIKEIAEKIDKAGGRLYLVGGAIRDTLLNRQVLDEDYSVTGLTQEEFKSLFPDAISRGKAFQVFDLEKKEFAIARKEIKQGKGHKDFKIETKKEITIEEDLIRRDITINSIAKDVLTEEIIDPFGGINDIKNKVIRATSNSFIEDPLRVYRLARFSAKFEFSVDKDTIELMSSLKNELETLSKERVFTEFKKALESDKPSIFFDILKESKVLEVHFKEIYNLIGSIQPEKYHPEGDSYNHTMIALDNVSKITDDVVIRFSTLVHDLGKGVTKKENYPHHYGHDIKGKQEVKNLAKRIGLPTKWIKCGITSSLEHMRGGMFYKMTPSKQVQFIERVEKSLLGLEGLQYVIYADRARIGNIGDIIDEKYNFIKLANKLLSTIDGNYIKEKYNIKSGIKFGEKLHEERLKWIKENKQI